MRMRCNIGRSHWGVVMVVAAGFALLALAGQVQATVYYWDSSGTDTGAGATPTGTWGTDSFWNTIAGGGSGGTFVSTLTSADDAWFCAGSDAVNAYTVTVNGTQNAKTVHFQEGSPTLTGGTIAIPASGAQFYNSATVAGTCTVESAILVDTSGGGPILLTLLANDGPGEIDLLIQGGISANTPANTYQLRPQGAGVGRIESTISHHGGAVYMNNSGTWTIAGNQDLGTSGITLPGANNKLVMGDTTNDVQSWAGITVSAASALLTVKSTATGSGTVVLRGGGGTMDVQGAFAGTGFSMGDASSNYGVLKLSGGSASFVGAGSGFAVSGTGSKIIGGAASDGTLTIGNSSLKTFGSELTFGGVGANENNFGLVKIGAGTLTLSAANTYVGGTTISNATLAVTAAGAVGSGDVTLVNGGTFDITGISSTFALSAGQSLKGVGTVAATGKTLSAGGGVAPGIGSGDSTGTLTVNGGLTLGASASSTFEITGTSAGEFDKLIVNGLLTFGGILNLSTVGSYNVGDTVDLFDWSTTSGTYSSITGIQIPGVGSWDTSSIYTDGTITVLPPSGTVISIR